MLKEDFPLLVFMDGLVYVAGVMGGMVGQVMTNSGEVKGDVGSGWWMVEEGGGDVKCIKNDSRSGQTRLFQAELTVNPS